MRRTLPMASAVLEGCQRAWHRRIILSIGKVELILARCPACIGIATASGEYSTAIRRLSYLARAVLVAAILLTLTAAAPAKDERRIALVIGISAYQNAPRLTNPVNDARVIGESLRRLKFDVAELYDLNLEELGRGIRDFGVRAATADVAVVYYAGHGVQVAGENYLIPANAHLERQRDLLY